MKSDQTVSRPSHAPRRGSAPLCILHYAFYIRPKAAKLIASCCLIAAITTTATQSAAQSSPPINTTISAKTAAKVEPAKALAVAKKYWLWSSPIIEPPFKNEFKKVINWTPAFDGAKKDESIAIQLSADIAVLNAQGGATNTATALACAAFDAASNYVEPAQNLGCAIATFCDDNADAKIRAKENEIYSDAETLLLYAIYKSLNADKYTAGSLDSLVALGNLYLDMKKYEDAKDKFETALKIHKSYQPALDGMAAYYQAIKDSKKLTASIASIRQTAKENPSEVGKAFNELDKKHKPLHEERDRGSEAELEDYMEKIVDIDAVTYADFLETIDPGTARKIKDNAKMINGRMTITVPNVTVLTQFSDINESNEELVKKAMELVGQDLEYVAKYAQRYGLQMLNTQADAFENMGVNSKVTISGAGSMTMPEYMRKLAQNPGQFDDKDVEIDEADMQRKLLSHAQEMIGSIGRAMQGSLMNPNPEAGMGAIKSVAKMDPLVAVMGLNPYDYANSWDVLIQQYNIKPLTEKMNTLASYTGIVNAAASEKIINISIEFREKFAALYNEYLTQLMELSQQYEQKMEPLTKEFSRQYQIDPTNVSEALSNQMKSISAQHTLAVCALKASYHPRFKQLPKPYFKQATPIAAETYKKLEKYIPKMYQSVMKHIVYISDEKVRQQQEDKLVGTIAHALQGAISNVLTAYGMAGEGPISKEELEGECSPENLRKLEKDIKDAADFMKAQEHAFKNYKIDENSAFYKEHVKKYEHEINLILFRYRSNDHFTASNINIWTPNLSFSRDTYENHITGDYHQDGEVSIRGGVGPVSGEVKLGKTFVRDRNGVVHPVDERTEYSAGAGHGFFSLSSGRSYSTLRGSKSFNKLELTGNGYIDGWKEEYFGKAGQWVRTKIPSKDLWKGEYKID